MGKPYPNILATYQVNLKGQKRRMFIILLRWKRKDYENIAGLNDSKKITPEEMAQFIVDNAEFIFTESK